MKTGLIAYAILIFLTAYSVQGHSHARLLPGGVLVPRNNNSGLKVGPCGGVAKSASPTILQKGQVVQVEWEETVNHPGRYEFYFSISGEQNFVLLKTVEDTQNRVDDLPHRYSTDVQLPDVECTDCVFQMIQVMTENPDFPRNYYSCADVELRVDTNMPPVSPTPAPTPGTEPLPDPHTCE